MKTLGHTFPTLGRCHRIYSFFQVNELDQRVLLFLSFLALIIIKLILNAFSEVETSTNIFQNCSYRELMLHTTLVATSVTKDYSRGFRGP